MQLIYHHRIASKDGQFVHVEELTNALHEQGHEIVFVCPRFVEQSGFGSTGGIAARLKSMLPRGVYELLELAYSTVVATRLVAAILRRRPDYIYERYNLYQPAGVIVARLFRIPLLLEVNAPLADERREHSGLALYRLARAVERFTWRRASHVLPVTRVLSDIIEAAGVPGERITVVPNGISRHVLDRLTPGWKRRQTGGPIVIGFTGFINPWHRLDRALHAIASCSREDVRFVCVGEGKIRPELEALARQLGIGDRVEFTGLVSREEVFAHVARFDIALQPAVTSYASPLKLFEYLAVGALVIAPATANIREILDTGNALLFDPEDENSFPEQLQRAIEHFDELLPLRQQARATLDDRSLTWQDNASRVTRIASSLVHAA